MKSRIIIVLSAALAVGTSLAQATEKERKAPVLPMAQFVDRDVNADKVLIALVDVIPELAEPDMTPTVRVFGDGRVLVHKADYLKNPGTWETWLGSDELDQLLATVTPTLYDFDEREVKNEVQVVLSRPEEAESGSVTPLFAQPGAPISFMSLDVESFSRANGLQEVVVSEPIQVAWKGLSVEAKRYSEVTALAQLKAVEDTIRALAARDDLVAVLGDVQ